MSDFQPPPITGYRPLTAEQVDRVNDAKALEARVKLLLDEIGQAAKDDQDHAAQRWCAIARTYLETGFMYVVKAVTRPFGGFGR